MEQFGEVQHGLTKNSAMHVCTKRTLHCPYIHFSRSASCHLQMVSTRLCACWPAVRHLGRTCEPQILCFKVNRCSPTGKCHTRSEETAVHLKGHPRRRKAFSSALTLAYCNFPTMLCMDWEFWTARKSCSFFFFFCLNLLGGKKKKREMLLLFVCCGHSAECLSLFALSSSFHFPSLSFQP